ncbi:zinc-binding dehydrogenase [Microbacterium sp. PRC9]|uniref:zinc-binding dehydrogenase n=1 Tax=Microbacterium sp. PRC9 TaxID=2962591 RepID=UPI002881A567|nr:zinc-binding dehydrogenase [Microbacterium sp. PRC9]MDT0144539.1 zinc-binding dehydrogenase [Microbacterium sp. PRC9]
MLLPAPGAPDALVPGEADRPEPTPGYVRVRVEACGLNPVDAGLARRGSPAWRWPHVLGLDVAGVVDAVSPEAEFEPGERVAFHGDLRARGGLAEYAIADERALARIPDGVDFTAAAALPCAGMTAYQAVVRRLHVQSGDTVLVTAGNGGVGGFAVQLAKRAGARVIATASSRFDRLRALGADAVVDYRDPEAQELIRSSAGDHGIDAVVDTVSATSATANLGLLSHAGGIACIAGRAELDAVAPFTISPSIHEISLGAAYSAGRDRHVRDLGRMLSELLALVEANVLDATVSRVVPLEDAGSALVEIAGGHATGKLVVRVRD